MPASFPIKDASHNASDELFVNVASLSQGSVPPWLKTAAVRATRFPQGGFTVGVWLSTVCDEHLGDVLQAADTVRKGDSDSNNQTDLALLALLLAQGEGLPIRQGDDINEVVERVLVLVSAERARRQRLVEFNPLYLSLESLEQAGFHVTREGGRLLLKPKR